MPPDSVICHGTPRLLPSSRAPCSTPSRTGLSNHPGTRYGIAPSIPTKN